MISRNRELTGYLIIVLDDCLHYISKVKFVYARLKNGRIMLYPSASVRPSVNVFGSV